MPQRFNLVSYAQGKLILFEPVTFESVDVALRRFLDLNLKAVFEVVKRAVELRQPQPLHCIRRNASAYISLGRLEKVRQPPCSAFNGFQAGRATRSF